MAEVPEISIVIPTCGRHATLREVLTKLFEQSYDPTQMEIIVVVDGPDAATESMLAEQARHAPCPLHALPQPRSGQGIARNRGIERASGRIVLMLDDDIIAVPQLVAEHARHHAGRDDAVVIGPVPVERTPCEPAHQRQIRTWWDQELREKASPAHTMSFRDFVTGNVSVARRRLLEVGGFDPAFAGYGREDYELGHRLLRAGLHFIYEPKAVGVHRYTKPPLDWIRQWRSMGKADVIFARKHPDIAREVMALSAFPYLPLPSSVVRAAEHAALALNERGGSVWSRSAAFAMSAHYWRGVREAVSGPEELRAHRDFRRDLRRSLRRPNFLVRLLGHRVRLEPR